MAAASKVYAFRRASGSMTCLKGRPFPICSYVGNGKLLDRQFFDTLLEAKVLIGRWRKDYNTVTYTFQGRQRCAGEETAAIEGGVLGRFAPARGANGATR